MTSADAGRYPRTIHGEAGDLQLRYMTAADEAAVLAFARALPDHDLLFLPRDIAQPKVLAAWIAEIERDALTTLLAVRDATLVGCATIACEEFSWSAHVGEIRVVVAADMRGEGIGRLLIQETFRIALRLRLEKLTAQMTVAITSRTAPGSSTTWSFSATTWRGSSRRWRHTERAKPPDKGRQLRRPLGRRRLIPAVTGLCRLTHREL